MEAALQALQKSNVGIVVLQDTKLTGGIHTRYGVCCKVWATEAESRYRGGIATVYQDEIGWKVEGAMSFGSNVVSFTIMLGRKL